MDRKLSTPMPIPEMPMVTFIAVSPEATRRSRKGTSFTGGGGTSAVGSSTAVPWPSMRRASLWSRLARSAVLGAAVATTAFLLGTRPSFRRVEQPAILLRGRFGARAAPPRRTG
jgi:hypothetical protein